MSPAAPRGIMEVHLPPSGSRISFPRSERSADAEGSPGLDPSLSRRLEVARDYDGIFRVVRAAVRGVLGVERPGLGLGLSELPPGLGAYWQVTGNLIVLNANLVRTMKSMAKEPREFNSFVYVLLSHEYLHALGYLDEGEVRRVTARVARRAFGADHLVTRMAEGDLWTLYPFLRWAPSGDGRKLTVVSRFDTETTASYIR